MGNSREPTMGNQRQITVSEMVFVYRSGRYDCGTIAVLKFLFSLAFIIFLSEST